MSGFSIPQPYGPNEIIPQHARVKSEPSNTVTDFPGALNQFNFNFAPPPGIVEGHPKPPVAPLYRFGPDTVPFNFPSFHGASDLPLAYGNREFDTAETAGPQGEEYDELAELAEIHDDGAVFPNSSSLQQEKIIRRRSSKGKMRDRQTFPSIL